MRATSYAALLRSPGRPIDARTHVFREDSGGVPSVRDYAEPSPYAPLSCALFVPSFRDQGASEGTRDLAPAALGPREAATRFYRFVLPEPIDATHALKPPSRSGAHAKPSSRSEAAAKLEAYPSEQMTTAGWSWPVTCSRWYRPDSSNRHSRTFRSTTSAPGQASLSDSPGLRADVDQEPALVEQAVEFFGRDPLDPGARRSSTRRLSEAS